jgi:hypothetical protein
MEQIYINAYKLVLSQIKTTGEYFSKVDNEYELDALQKVMFKYMRIKFRIEQRVKSRHNVVYVDFKSKKRVA